MDTDPENNNEFRSELLADDAAKETYKTIKQTFKTVGNFLKCK